MQAAAVTTTEPSDLEPIRRRDDLLVPFVEACKPSKEWRIGPEMEKFGLLEDVRRPLPYVGDRSVVRVLEELAVKHGWEPEREHEGGPVVALARHGASVTLEPGGQLELSGAKSETIHGVCSELRAHMREFGRWAFDGWAWGFIRSRSAAISRGFQSSATASCANTCLRGAVTRST